MSGHDLEVQPSVGTPCEISEVGGSFFSRYRKTMHRLALLTLANFCTPNLLHAETVVPLYDPARPENFSEQGWLPVTTNLDHPNYFFQIENGLTSFDSFPVEYGAAWTTVGLITGNALHPNSPILDPQKGFTLSFHFALDEEVHLGGIDVDEDGMVDEAGFTVMMLDRRARGVAIQFWEDRIWSSGTSFVGSRPPFPQAEFVEQIPTKMATLRRYELTIVQNAYRLRIEGQSVLEGRTRSYDYFNEFVDPFDKPNIINIGDASRSAAARARIGAVSIKSGFQRQSPLALRLLRSNDALQLSWNSIPGCRYLVQSSDTLNDWKDVTTLDAQQFTTVHLESLNADASSRYYRVVELAP